MTQPKSSFPPPSLSLYVPKLVDQPTNRIITNQETRKLNLLAQLNELTVPIIPTSWIFSGNKPFLVSLSHPALLLSLQPKPTQMVLRMKTWNLPLMANKRLPHRVPVMPRVPGPWLVLHSAWQHCWSQSWSLAGVAIRPFKERAAVWWSHWFPLSATQLMSKEAYEFELPRNFFLFSQT